MNESDKEEQEKVIQFLNVFNRPLRRKLKEMGVHDSDYPFSKCLTIEKVIRLTDKTQKQISYKYDY